MKASRRPKGIVGYRPAGLAERGMRRLSRNVKEAAAKEKGVTFSPTKKPNKNRTHE